jgi:hypothetical protein
MEFMKTGMREVFVARITASYKWCDGETAGLMLEWTVDKVLGQEIVVRDMLAAAGSQAVMALGDWKLSEIERAIGKKDPLNGTSDWLHDIPIGVEVSLKRDGKTWQINRYLSMKEMEKEAGRHLPPSSPRKTQDPADAGKG